MIATVRSYIYERTVVALYLDVCQFVYELCSVLLCCKYVLVIFAIFSLLYYNANLPFCEI